MRSSQRRQVGNEGDQNNFGQGRGKETKINLTSGVYLDVCNWRAPRLATNDADGGFGSEIGKAPPTQGLISERSDLWLRQWVSSNTRQRTRDSELCILHELIRKTMR